MVEQWLETSWVMAMMPYTDKERLEEGQSISGEHSKRLKFRLNCDFYLLLLPVPLASILS